MKQSDIDTLNRRARMTPEERDEDIVREMFGPHFDRMFQGLAKPETPNDEKESAS